MLERTPFVMTFLPLILRPDVEGCCLDIVVGEAVVLDGGNDYCIHGSRRLVARLSDRWGGRLHTEPDERDVRRRDSSLPFR